MLGLALLGACEGPGAGWGTTEAASETAAGAQNLTGQPGLHFAAGPAGGAALASKFARSHTTGAWPDKIETKSLAIYRLEFEDMVKEQPLANFTPKEFYYLLEDASGPVAGVKIERDDSGHLIENSNGGFDNLDAKILARALVDVAKLDTVSQGAYEARLVYLPRGLKDWGVLKALWLHSNTNGADFIYPFTGDFLKEVPMGKLATLNEFLSAIRPRAQARLAWISAESTPEEIATARAANPETPAAPNSSAPPESPPVANLAYTVAKLDEGNETGKRAGGAHIPLGAHGAINASGQIVGQNGSGHAFLYSMEGWQDLGTLGGETSQANAINTSGQVAGTADPKGDAAHAFLYSNGQMHDLGLLYGADYPSEGHSLNAAGQVVGNISSGAEGAVSHAFIASGGRMQDLNVAIGKTALACAGTAGFKYLDDATGINDRGEIVGSGCTDAGAPRPALLGGGWYETYHAFLFNDGRVIDLGTLGGYRSDANAINASGQIVGTSFLADAANGEQGPPRAFLYSGGQMQNLGALNSGPKSESRANGINAAGQIVGNSTFADEQAGALHAFIYSGGQLRDLNTLVGEAALTTAGIKTLTDARGINDRGEIIGMGEDAQGNAVAFLLTPAEGKTP